MTTDTKQPPPPPSSSSCRGRGTVLRQDDGTAYLSGFGNAFESECVPGALPVGRNTPKNAPYDLYAEQLSGTAFTAPRASNRRTWLYRIRPSVVAAAEYGPRKRQEKDRDEDEKVFFLGGVDPAACETTVDPLRWKPMPAVDATASGATTTDFVSGMRLICSGGDVSATTGSGLCIYMYRCVAGMSVRDRHFRNADGDFLIVPQCGSLRIVTEMGVLIVRPTEIVVIPRGVVFQVDPFGDGGGQDGGTESHESGGDFFARGYVLEIFKGGFVLPELGPIGANGLANARDFWHPVAACQATTRDEYSARTHAVLCKLHGKVYARRQRHCPYDVVAWHGNYLPYKYDLKRFCAVNSVTYDHLDPSVYTVLTCPTETTAGTALADFVVFPPRVAATDEDTFRPPYYHRNRMSEFMGLIRGRYDAKASGFLPGGASLHGCMTPHGPDRETYRKAVADPCSEPAKIDAGWAFMFETCFPLKVAPAALDDVCWLDADYADCWRGLDDQFKGWKLLEEQVALQKQQQGKESYKGNV